MEKRGRGRPRKIVSHNLSKKMVNLPNEKVPYSDDLPEFFKIYTSALSSKTMRIPPDFIDKVGVNVPTTWTLRRPSRVSWQVDMNTMNDGWFFQKGWPEFVLENSLKEDDFLTFCFVGNSTFSVTIFSPNGCTKGADQDTSRSDETSESENSEINESKRRVLRGRSSVGKISANHSFPIKMLKSYVEKGIMLVPMEFWSWYVRENKKEKEGSRMVTLWVKNDKWIVNLVTYPGRVLLQRGCSKFIRDNSLKVGTSCTFQLIHTNHLSFKVTITR